MATTLKRKLASRQKISYYEAGMDLGLSDDLEESYEKFQSRLKREYERIALADRFTIIDSSRPVEEIQRALRDHVRPILENFPTGAALTHDS